MCKAEDVPHCVLHGMVPEGVDGGPREEVTMETAENIGRAIVQPGPDATLLVVGHGGPVESQTPLLVLQQEDQDQQHDY